MSIFFEGRNKIAGLRLGELTIRNIGPQQGVSARLAFLSAGGITMGDIVVHTLNSPKTQKLLQQLVDSLEEDALAMFTESGAEPEPVPDADALNALLERASEGETDPFGL